MNSLVVFLPGNIAGRFGSEVKWSYLLNVPYALFPMLFVVRLFGQRTPLDDGDSSPSLKREKISFMQKIFDLTLAIMFAGLSILAFVRLFASLNSPAIVASWWKNTVAYIV